MSTTYLPIRFPLFWEELRRRMRGGRAQVVLLIYTLLLITLLFFVTQMNDISTNPREWPRFGKTLWQVFMVAQMAIIIFISPGLTAGAISSEKEQGTLDMLLLTRMGSLSIVLGKFFGALGQMLYLLLAGLPIISVVFFFGGVSPGDIAMGYTLTIATGIGYASLGFFMSCRCKRVVPAVAWSYALMLLMAVVLPLLTGLLLQMADVLNGLGPSIAALLMVTNPLATYVTLLIAQAESSGKAFISLWPTIFVMLGITVLVIAESTMMVRRLRGLSKRFIPKTLRKPIGRVKSEG